MCRGVRCFLCINAVCRISVLGFFVCLCVHVAVRLIVSGRACVNVFVRADACARVRGGVPAVVTMVGLFSFKKRRRFRRRFADTVFDVGCCRGSLAFICSKTWWLSLINFLPSLSFCSATALCWWQGGRWL